MKGIGGNTTASIQVHTITKNKIGEAVKEWVDVQSIKGWLDFQSGEARYSTYNAKIEESTHLFIADYVPLDSRITLENARMVVKFNFAHSLSFFSRRYLVLNILTM